MTDEQMDARLRAAGQRWRDRSDGDTVTTEPADLEEDLLVPPSRRRRTWFVAAAAAAVVALIAGLTFALRGEPRHGTPNAETAGLQGVVWLLQGAHGVRSTASLYIDRNGNLVADDECRLLGGHASVTGTRLTVSDLVVRYKPCTDQYGAGFYDQGTNVLRGPATYSVDSAGLIISRGTQRLRFVPAPKPVPPPSLDVPTLTDTTWRAPGAKTLRIDARTGAISGTACTGHAVVSGPKVTLAGCAHSVDQSYLATVTAATLTLRSTSFDPGFSGKVRLLTFVWQPSDPSTTDPAAIIGRTWALESVAGRSARAGSLHIEHGIAVVDDGCHTFSLPVAVSRGALTVSGEPPHEPCPAQAATVDSILSGQPAAWVVRDGKLLVYGGGSQAFSLVYGSAQQTYSSLLQGQWTLAKVFDAAGGVRPATARATLTIAADGTVTGTDGCRTFSGTVAISGTTATFSLTMPEPACSPLIEQTASLVDQVLSGPVTFTVAPGALVLSKTEIGRLSFTGKVVGGQDPQLLTAHSWQITTITYGTGHFRNGAPAQDQGFLTFRTHSYEVRHTCSVVHATALLDAGTMTLGEQHTVGHSCPPAPPDQTYTGESVSAIDAILTGEVRWSIDGSLLTLSSTKGTLTAIGGIRSDLTGSRWRLTATSRGNISRAAVGSVVLSFPSSDRLTVDRCYTSGAKVAVGDSSFTAFGLHTTIARPCPSGPPGTQQQNEIIDSVLTSEPLWSIVGNTLTLTGSGASLTFRR